jgi:glycosyltransferase involved in cell wall biosynthesis
MNIGIDARCLMEKELSGVGYYTAEMITALLKIDKKNQYYLYTNSWRDNKKNIPVFAGKNVHYVHTRFPNKIIHLSIVLFRRPKLDNFFPINLDLFWEPTNHFFSISKDIRLVVTCHDVSWKIFPELYTRKGLFWHWVLQLGKVYKKANKIIAVSEHTKTDLQRVYSILETKVKVIHSGLPIIKSTLEINNIELPAKKYFLFLGNIEPRKNIESIVDAFLQIADRLPDIDLVLAGGDKLAPRFARKLFKRIAIYPRIYYIGYVSDTIKQKLYSQATAFVFPSWHEGFGFPPLEAMARSIPVIASNITALPEVLGGAAYYINPYNTAELANAMLRLATDNELRTRLVSAGKNQVIQYNWETAATQLLSEFKNCI